MKISVINIGINYLHWLELCYALYAMRNQVGYVVLPHWCSGYAPYNLVES